VCLGCKIGFLLFFVFLSKKLMTWVFSDGFGALYKGLLILVWLVVKFVFVKSNLK